MLATQEAADFSAVLAQPECSCLGSRSNPRHGDVMTQYAMLVPEYKISL
jgi:hypothetical protein